MTFKNRRGYLSFLKQREVSINTKKRWNGEYLDNMLGTHFDIIRPRMPLSENARYEEWKIHFERLLPFLRDGAFCIGFSLGGIFLAKYLSENHIKKKLGAVFLIAPPFDDTLVGEDLAGGFALKKHLSLLEKNAPHLFLFFSRDDEIVPLETAEKYRAKLPHAHVLICKNKKGHFGTASFPELVAHILKK